MIEILVAFQKEMDYLRPVKLSILNLNNCIILIHMFLSYITNSYLNS